MKIATFIFLFLFCIISAQKELPLDTLKIRETKDFFADDYGNIYLYKNKNFSFTKFDSLGKQQGRMMFTVPFQIKSVQNPLNIVLFSENSQEIKLVDNNLNEIQKLDLQKFGFIKMAYTEDLQQVWLLDESMKRLVQYNFREDKIIGSYPFNISFDEIKDMLIFENKIFLIRKNEFLVYDFRGNSLFATITENPVKLRRENDRIYIIEKNKIQQLLPNNTLKILFESPFAQIVDKNSSSYFEIKGNKVYLYHSK